MNGLVLSNLTHSNRSWGRHKSKRPAIAGRSFCWRPHGDPSLSPEPLLQRPITAKGPSQQPVRAAFDPKRTSLRGRCGHGGSRAAQDYACRASDLLRWFAQSNTLLPVLESDGSILSSNTDITSLLHKSLDVSRCNGHELRLYLVFPFAVQVSAQRARVWALVAKPKDAMGVVVSILAFVPCEFSELANLRSQGSIGYPNIGLRQGLHDRPKAHSVLAVKHRESGRVGHVEAFANDDFELKVNVRPSRNQIPDETLDLLGNVISRESRGPNRLFSLGHIHSRRASLRANSFVERLFTLRPCPRLTGRE